MAEATLTLSQTLDRATSGQVIAPDSKWQAQLRASMSLATHTLARQAAMKATKRQLQAQGFKVNRFPHRDIVSRAEAYLAAHREELIAEAREIVARWRVEGFFGKRARLLSDAQGGKALNRRSVFAVQNVRLKIEERNMIVGYARVSTDSQTLDAQQSSLSAAGAEKVFAEKVSGAVTDRKALAKAIAALGAGDVLLVTRLDRLARSTRDLLNVLDAVSKAGAGFRSLADAWADTTSAHGRLMLTVLGGLAEFERELIKARTEEGRKRAQARGVRFGRKLKLTRHQVLEALARREAGEALAEIGRSYNVSHSTISRL